jgi:nucleoid-associated protein YgaU
MARTSRYQDTPPFQAARGERVVFPGLRPRLPSPATPVLEHTLKATDRLDLIALHYYNDTRLWWRILDANPEVLCGADLSGPGLAGTVILIPAAEEPGGGT